MVDRAWAADFVQARYRSRLREASFRRGVLLESCRRECRERVAFRSRRCGRSFGATSAACKASLAAGACPRSRCGDDPPISGGAGWGTLRRRDRHVSLPIPIHGATPSRTRSPAGAYRGRKRRRVCRAKSRSGFVPHGRRQVYGRPHDFHRCVPTSAGSSARTRFLRVPAPPARAAWRQTRRSSRESQRADAVLARNPRHVRGSRPASAGLRKTRLVSDTSCHRIRGSLVPRSQEFRKDRCRGPTRISANHGHLGEELGNLATDGVCSG